jgi:NAD(P)-dependent dehydrogenase (short-subunit alcohol dehydrogenase family)
MSLAGRVTVVTGASRGVGKGIAVGLGEAGATVYATGRSSGAPTYPVLGGTVEETARAVTAAGGHGVAVRCDHRDDAQTRALVDRVAAEQGRLDVLVNNVWAGYAPYHEGRPEEMAAPFWEQPLRLWDDMLGAGVRAHYVTTALAAPLMLERGGLVVVTSFLGGTWFREEDAVAYSVAKAADDRMALAMAAQLRRHAVAVVSLYPGLVRTEGVLRAAEFFDLRDSESPQFLGRCVAALAADPDVLRHSGRALVAAEVAEEYGVTDVDGRRPPSIRPS